MGAEFELFTAERHWHPGLPVRPGEALLGMQYSPVLGPAGQGRLPERGGRVPQLLPRPGPRRDQSRRPHADRACRRVDLTSWNASPGGYWRVPYR